MALRKRRVERKQLFGKTLFVDLMMSTLIVVTTLLMIANVVKRAKAEQEEASLNTAGEYAVVMTWPDDSKDDVDLYVRNPRNNIVFWRSKESGLMHLEHDDRGAVGDWVETESGSYGIDKNEERVILRGLIPGEYVVNAHMFRKSSASAATKVVFRLIKLRGAYDEVIRTERELSFGGDEQTGFRFTLAPDGRVVETNELPARFTGQAGGKLEQEPDSEGGP